MSGLWGNNSSGAAPTKGLRAVRLACVVCGRAVRRFTSTSHPMCTVCGANVVTARFQLEREGVLPRHQRSEDLADVYSHPLVIERAREIRTTVAASAAGPRPTRAHEEAPISAN